MSDFQTEFARHYAIALDLLLQGRSSDEVYKHILDIEDEDYRNSTFRKVAALLAERNDVAEAFRYCLAIVRPLERADAFFAVGRALKDIKEHESAKEAFFQATSAAESIQRDSVEIAGILLQVANELRELGEKERALHMVDRAVVLTRPNPQGFEASKTLRGSARILAKWNLLPQAVEVAQSIESPELRAAALNEIHGRGEWPVYPDIK